MISWHLWNQASRDYISQYIPEFWECFQQSHPLIVSQVKYSDGESNQ